MFTELLRVHLGILAISRWESRRTKVIFYVEQGGCMWMFIHARGPTLITRPAHVTPIKDGAAYVSTTSGANANFNFTPA